MYDALAVVIPPMQIGPGDMLRVTRMVGWALAESGAEEWLCDHWDVGGCYTGMLDGHDPKADPGNFRTCPYCGGTGRVPSNSLRMTASPHDDDAATGGEREPCCYCDGEGREYCEPSYPGDVRPVEFVLERFADPEWPGFGAVLTSGLELEELSRDRRAGTDQDEVWRRRQIELLEAEHGRSVVVVEYHS